MKNIYFLLLSALLSCYNTDQMDNDKPWYQDEQLNATWSRWHKDSLGCLHVRKWEDALYLIEKFDLYEKSMDSVKSILGQPNYSSQGYFMNEQDQEIEVIKYSYYFNTWCQADSLQPESFMRLLFSLHTNKLIAVKGGVH